MRTNDERLAVLFQRINHQYFQDQLKIRGIFWTKRQKLVGKNFQHWAQCLTSFKGICILDRLKNIAPDYVLKYLIFHECLHFCWLNHCNSFWQAEKEFKQLKKADHWLDRHDYLLETE